MATKFRTLTEAEWVKKYKPLPNTIDQTHGFDFGEGCCLYETYGAELGYIRFLADTSTRQARRIWTVLDSDGRLDIVSGIHIVNRFGYIVTEEPCGIDEHITVEDEEEVYG